MKQSSGFLRRLYSLRGRGALRRNVWDIGNDAERFPLEMSEYIRCKSFLML